MIFVIISILTCTADMMHRDLVASYAKAVVAPTPTQKYEIMSRALTQLERRMYSAKRADAIGLLYASLLVQDIPKATKLRICHCLSQMSGLDSSIDGILLFAQEFRAEADSLPQVNRLRVNRFNRTLKDAELVDDLIRSLQTQKQGNRHMQGGFLFIGDRRR